MLNDEEIKIQNRFETSIQQLSECIDYCVWDSKNIELEMKARKLIGETRRAYDAWCDYKPFDESLFERVHDLIYPQLFTRRFQRCGLVYLKETT